MAKKTKTAKPVKQSQKRETVDKPAKKTTKKQTIEETIKELTDKLLSYMQISGSTEVVAGQDHYDVNITTQESGLLIGRYGETLNSLQLLLGVMLFKKRGEWIRVIVDVGDYRKSRQQSLSEMAQRIAGEVETTGQPVTIPNLTPYERRTIHMLLSQHKSVMTESIGEGRDRRLTIKPR